MVIVTSNEIRWEEKTYHKDRKPEKEKDSSKRMEKRKSKQCRQTGAWRSGRGPGTRLCCIYLCLSRSYNSLSIVQINPFRPSPSHPANESQPFRLSVEIFSRFALAKEPEKVFHRGPNPLLSALKLKNETVRKAETRREREGNEKATR